MIMVQAAVPPGQSGQNGHAAQSSVGERPRRVIRWVLAVAPGRVRTTAGTPAVPHSQADPSRTREPNADSTVFSGFFHCGRH